MQFLFIITKIKSEERYKNNIQKKKDCFNPLNANPEKWSNTLKQIVGNLPTICLSVFDHFMNLALKGLKNQQQNQKIIFSSAPLKLTQVVFVTYCF